MEPTTNFSQTNLSNLPSTSGPAIERKVPRRRWLWVVLVVAILLGGLTVWTGVNASSMLSLLSDGRAQMELAQAAVENLDFYSAQEPLKKAEQDFSEAYTRLLRIKWLEIIPWLGPQVSAVEEILKSSSDLFNIIEKISDLGSEVIGLISESQRAGGEGILPLHYDDLSPETKEIFLQRLNGASADLALAASKTDLLIKELSDLNEVPDPMGTVVRKIENILLPAKDVLSLASTAVRLIPSFAGLDKEHTFLLLLENNAELRPAGGFIGTYRILKIKNGEINELSTFDSYLLDSAAASYFSAEPPAPLKQYLSIDKWYFRDSNWSPDFPTASRQAISMFTSEVLSLPPEEQIRVQTPVSFDGVIALTPTFVADLLQITGPITIGDQTFSSDNITDTLEYDVEKGFAEDGLPHTQRKEIITSLLNEMKARIFDLSLSQWGPIVKAFENNLNEKQLVLFDNSSSEIEKVISEVNWGGLINPGLRDFLMVVDANLASLKTDPKVKRSIKYSVEPSTDGRFIGTAIITYDHNGDFDWKTTRYRTYARVYVPAGSELIQAAGFASDTIDAFQDLGATVFGGFISVEPGQTGQLSFRYYLPESIKNNITAGTYSLMVQKQIGAADYALTLDLNFGKKVAGATPSEAKENWGDNIYRLETILNTDKNFAAWF